MSLVYAGICCHAPGITNRPEEVNPDDLNSLKNEFANLKNEIELSKPDALFIIDVKREAIAVSEASKMGIPIIAVVDTNSSPEGIDYLVPGNDDSIRSIALFSRAVSDACLEGAKLATGIKPNVDNKGPKILKKEDKEVLLESKTESKDPKDPK